MCPGIVENREPGDTRQLSYLVQKKGDILISNPDLVKKCGIMVMGFIVQPNGGWL
jgi:hypothetical protein